jgi:hypothetical protein
VRLLRARADPARHAPLGDPQPRSPRAPCPDGRKRSFFAELIEGRGYSATLAVTATSIEEARAEARRYARAHGYRLGRIKRARGWKAGW